MKNFYTEYLENIDVENYRIIDYSKVTQEQLIELAKMYCTLFNSENKKFIKENKLVGKVSDEGIWNEEPYTFNLALDKLQKYTQNEYMGVVGIGTKENKDYVLGAVIVKKSSLEEMNLEGYSCPFDTSEILEYWMGVDTFKREFTVRNKRARHFSAILRQNLFEILNTSHHALFFSSTNNPIMTKAWKNERIYVVEKPNIKGYRFQGFKII